MYIYIYRLMATHLWYISKVHLHRYSRYIYIYIYVRIYSGI